MTLRDVMAELGLSRDSVYRRIRDKRLTPLPKINPHRDKEPLRFSRSDVMALKGAAQPDRTTEARAPYDPNG